MDDYKETLLSGRNKAVASMIHSSWDSVHNTREGSGQTKFQQNRGGGCETPPSAKELLVVDGY